GSDVVAGYGEEQRCSSGRGQQLMPWPNRIRDGRYTVDDTAHQLAITEVENHNASHGLVRWSVWELIEHTDAALTVGLRLFPQPGWDHQLSLRTSYLLDDSGLVVTTTARNVGLGAAPFGYGAHPYLSIGVADITEVRLQVPGGRWVEVDERSLPVATRPVEGDPHDFRTEREIGAALLDTAYCDLQRGADGRWRSQVTVPGASPVTLWGDEAFPWLQVFTGLGHLGRANPGVAIEPMSCPADAFNSGEDLVWLGPDEEWTGTWGISPG
ncbi:MAG: aldose 1-epimerase family protein, partial [Dermatophilaceae bacterium]